MAQIVQLYTTVPTYILTSSASSQHRYWQVSVEGKQRYTTALLQHLDDLPEEYVHVYTL